MGIAGLSICLDGLLFLRCVARSKVLHRPAGNLLHVGHRCPCTRCSGLEAGNLCLGFLDWLASAPDQGWAAGNGHSSQGESWTAVCVGFRKDRQETNRDGLLLRGCPSNRALRGARGAAVLVYFAGPISAVDALLYHTSRNREAPLNTTTQIPPAVKLLLISPLFSRSPSSVSGFTCCAVVGSISLRLHSHF